MIGSRASAALVLMASTMVAAAPPSVALDDPRPVGSSSTTDDDSQRVVVSFRGRVGQSSRAARSRDLLESLPAASYDVVHRYDNVAAIALEVDDAALAELEARDDVTVAYDSRVTAFDTESTTLMRADDAQAAGRTGDGVTVAVLDTGAYSSRGLLHPGLVDDVVEQRCFAGPDCLTRSEARDLGGHGTHVAGILTGPDGIAPDVDLRVYKVLDDDGNGWNSDIAAALDHVASLPPGSVDLVNMSLGGGVYGSTAACEAEEANRVTNDAIAAVVRAGITVLAATGNAGSTTGVAHPACAPGVIGVGAVEDRGVRRDGECRDLRPDRVSCYSNGTPVSGRGELVDVVAPGCRIASLGTVNDYDAVMCGTSMATPMATGVAALVLQEEDLTPAELEQRLEDTGVPVVDDRFRRPVTVPRVDAVAATGTPISDLTAPTEPAVAVPDAGSADLTWEPVAGAAGYRVYRSAARVRSRELVATTTEPGWSDETVPCGPVTYTLRTVDSDGTLSPGATLTAEARACPARPGTAPRLDPVDASTTRVSWPQQAGPVELEYRVSGGTPYTSVGVFDPGTGSVDHAVDGCGTAIYRLVAVAGDDRSIPSPVAWRSICGPVNDSRSAATTLPVPTADRPTAVTVDVARADWSSEDPVFDCVSEHQVGNNGVWYRLDPRRDVMVTMSTAGTTARRAGGRAAPMLAVYEVAPVGARQRDCSATTLDPFTNQVRYARTSLQLRRGHSYYVHLAHRYDLRADRPQEARLTLRWRADLRRVRGDDRSAPRVLTRDGQDVVAGAQNATVDDTDPVHRCMFGPTRSAGSHTLWWSLEPQRTGTAGLASFDNTGAFTDTVISLFAVDPDAPEGLRPVACSDDFDGSPAPFLRYRVTRGQQYLVMLSRASGVPTATESRVRLHYRLQRGG